MSGDLTINRQAPVRRVPLGDDSWVDVVDGFVRDPAAELEAVLADTAWTQTEVLRYDSYVAEQRLGAGLRSDARPLLRQAELHLQAAYRVTLTGVAAVLYRNGEDFQGLHSDRQMRWLDETVVAIMVLGQRRPFVLRPRAPLAGLEKVPAGADPADVVLMPGEGDLIVMGGACQRDFLHGVPRAETANPRISLTWRWSSRRGRPDTNPGYYEGRQYSDRSRQPGSRRRPL
ncbi:MAG: DNA-N1-methyladenine dioxygenase [Acidimicrobiia bacterium]|nr:DNA-N1-methyladenine dioxygenase [Acidimicrobiia bacterium]